MEETSKSSDRSTRYRIEIKLTAEEKELIVRGAAAAKQGISEFVRVASTKAALEALHK